MTQSEVRQRFVRAYPGVRRMGMKGYWYRCAHCGCWCGRPGGEKANIPDGIKMEVDHIMPWSQGGSDNLNNLQALCKTCNRSKSASATFRDNTVIAKNMIFHPVDTVIKGAARKAVRQNKVLKGLGITKRK